jgi:folate-dependent phosphoribosylglycinamide formyltransferase PurN
MLNVHPAPLPEFGGQGMYGMELGANVPRAAAYASPGDG